VNIKPIGIHDVRLKPRSDILCQLSSPSAL
jgi:hypothetical protein